MTPGAPCCHHSTLPSQSQFPPPPPRAGSCWIPTAGLKGTVRQFLPMGPRMLH